MVFVDIFFYNLFFFSTSLVLCEQLLARASEEQRLAASLLARHAHSHLLVWRSSPRISEEKKDFSQSKWSVVQRVLNA